MANQFVCSILLLIAAKSTYADGIEGGVAANTSDREYVVQLVDTDGTIICGGALLNSLTVITAASCLALYDDKQLKVATNNGKKKIGIAGYRYNGYDFITNENDIALVKLAEPVSAKYVKLPSKQPVTGSTAVLTGWDAKNSLVDVSETIISADDCDSGKYSYEEGDLFDSNVCGLAKNQACGGVPGNPLVSNNQLIGVVSGGFGCPNKANPAIFTSVYPEKSWITSTVKSW